MTLEQAVALHQRGAVREAAVAYVAFLRTHPDHPDALRFLAMALLALGHPGEALATLDRVPNARHWVIAANRGQILAALGRWDDAAQALERSLRSDPDQADTWAALAAAESGRGRAGAAARALGRALVLEPSRARAVAFADAVAVTVDPPADLRDALSCAYAIDGVDHALLDRAAVRGIPHDPAAAADDPLTTAWLTRGSVPSAAEARVVALRAWLVDHPGRAVVAAMGVAAWAAEYAWDDTGRDRAASPAARAMFGPVDEPGVPDTVLRCLRDLPAREAELAAAVPTLDAGQDHALRAMYEENPYPRRVSVHVREPVPVAEWLSRTFPAHPPFTLPHTVDLLVAGCGTGRHALQSATTFRARVTGLDLSRASLGRAARRADELGVPLELLHADLRELGGWDRRFDVVESVGVLHHLPDWVEGLRVLVGLVRPGGVVRIGLYSERARSAVVAARAFVAERGFADDADGIRAARAALRALPSDHPAADVVRSVDFGSVSGCRDLVFHVREHRVTPPEIARGLAACGLHFVGFQHALPDAARRYAEAWPDDLRQDDLDRWDSMEERHPALFAGMFVFWAEAAG